MGSLGASSFNMFGDYHNIINGEPSTTSKTRHGINPATEKPNPEVPVSTQEDVNAAIDAAQKAFPSWSTKSYEERRKAVRAFADGLEEHADDFAKLLTQEQGKPLSLAQRELESAVRWARASSDLNLEEEVVNEADDRHVVVRYVPLGVAVGIVPWNFPVYLSMAKIAPALLVGCTMILKPSPFTPYCNIKMVELAQSFFPPGVLQILSGEEDLGPMLTAHPVPAKISFTGSSATGKKVMEAASKTLKRVTLELGGNDPAIVCADIDVDKVAPAIIELAFANSGQICIAIKRIYVHESIHDKFRDAIVRHAKTMKVGDGAEADTRLGPVQNSMQYEKVKSLFDEIEKEQWSVVLGGKNEERTGYFITPTIIDKPADSSRITVEEPFGPIVPLLTWRTEEEVLARANDTQMGLGSSVWSNDIAQATRIGRQLQAGYVWINTHMELDSNAPFGGHKHSGLGSENGIGGLKSYCNSQTFFIKKAAEPKKRM